MPNQTIRTMCCSKVFVKAKNWLLLLLLFLLSLPNAAQSQNFFSQFELEEGPHKVGVKGFNYPVFSRVYLSADGATRKPRKVFGLLWLPMDKAQQDRLSDSTYPELYENISANFSSDSYRNRFIRRGARESIVDEIINASKISEIEDDKIKADYPIIIYYPGFGSPPFDNAVLCEYLASHGFLVVALSHQGNSEYGSYPSPVDLEAAVKDVEFITGKYLQMSDQKDPFIGLMGHSWGGLVSYLAATKNPLYSAVISLDASTTASEIMDMAKPFVSDEMLDAMSAPLLAFVSAGYHHDYSMMRRKKYNPTILGKSWFMGHHEFTANGILFIDFASADGVREISDFKMDKVGKAYKTICRTSLQFLNYAMSEDNAGSFSAMRDALMANDSFSFAIERGEQPIPSQQAFEHMLQSDDFEKTVGIFHRAILLDPAIKLFSEDLALSVADYYLDIEETDKAKMVYGMVVTAYPNSANALYKQGVYFEKTGLKEVAGRYYTWALEKNSDHLASQKALKQIEEVKPKE